jgi:hypothetical protein
MVQGELVRDHFHGVYPIPVGSALAWRAVFRRNGSNVGPREIDVWESGSDGNKNSDKQSSCDKSRHKGGSYSSKGGWPARLMAVSKM